MPSVSNLLTPSYALTTSKMALEVRGALFNASHSYMCMFNDEYTTNVSVVTASLLTCPGPSVIYNRTQLFTVSLYREGILMHQYNQSLTLYSPSLITNVSTNLFDTQGVTSLIIEADGVLPSSLRLQPLKCQFNLVYNGTGIAY
jgi:hypothetical protein